jgi:hypothetical protein
MARCVPLALAKGEGTGVRDLLLYCNAESMFFEPGLFFDSKLPSPKTLLWRYKKLSPK